jgi:hypothetical protein
MDPEIKEIKTEQVPLGFEFRGTKYFGKAIPLATSCRENACYELDIVLNNKQLGTIYCDKDFKCSMHEVFDAGLVEKIAEELMLWYL